MIKAKINGIDIECDVSDFAQLLGIVKEDKKPKPVDEEIIILQPVKPEAKKKVIFKRSRRSYRKSDALMPKYQLVADLIRGGLKSNKAIKKIYHREACGKDYYYIYKLLGKNVRRFYKAEANEKHTIFTPDHKDFLRKRGVWVTNRAKFFIKDRQYSWTKALEMAQLEWNYQFGKKKTPVVQSITQKKFPEILANPDMNKILVEMLGRSLYLGGELQYSPDGVMAGISSPAEWEMTVIKVMQNVDAVLAYYESSKRLFIQKENKMPSKIVCR